MRNLPSDPTRFYAENTRACDDTQEAVLAACDRFLPVAEAVLPANDLSALRTALENKFNQGVFAVLRPNAAKFPTTSDYWNVIDALGFHIDALTANWPYVNDNDRQRFLTFALEKAGQVCREVATA